MVKGCHVIPPGLPTGFRPTVEIWLKTFQRDFLSSVDFKKLVFASPRIHRDPQNPGLIPKICGDRNRPSPKSGGGGGANSLLESGGGGAPWGSPEQKKSSPKKFMISDLQTLSQLMIIKGPSPLAASSPQMATCAHAGRQTPRDRRAAPPRPWALEAVVERVGTLKRGGDVTRDHNQTPGAPPRQRAHGGASRSACGGGPLAGREGERPSVKATGLGGGLSILPLGDQRNTRTTSRHSSPQQPGARAERDQRAHAAPALPLPHRDATWRSNVQVRLPVSCYPLRARDPR